MRANLGAKLDKKMMWPEDDKKEQTNSVSIELAQVQPANMTTEEFLDTTQGNIVQPDAMISVTKNAIIGDWLRVGR